MINFKSLDGYLNSCFFHVFLLRFRPFNPQDGLVSLGSGFIVPWCFPSSGPSDTSRWFDCFCRGQWIGLVKQGLHWRPDCWGYPVNSLKVQHPNCEMPGNIDDMNHQIKKIVVALSRWLTKSKIRHTMPWDERRCWGADRAVHPYRDKPACELLRYWISDDWELYRIRRNWKKWWNERMFFFSNLLLARTNPLITFALHIHHKRQDIVLHTCIKRGDYPTNTL